MKGLGSIYSQCMSFQQAVHLFFSLAYVPKSDVEDVFSDVIMEFFEEHMEDWDAEFGQRQEIEEFWVYLELPYIAKKTR